MKMKSVIASVPLIALLAMPLAAFTTGERGVSNFSESAMNQMFTFDSAGYAQSLLDANVLFENADDHQEFVRVMNDSMRHYVETRDVNVTPTQVSVTAAVPSAQNDHTVWDVTGVISIAHESLEADSSITTDDMKFRLSVQEDATGYGVTQIVMSRDM